jgi:hypothetical protein
LKKIVAIIISLLFLVGCSENQLVAPPEISVSPTAALNDESSKTQDSATPAITEEGKNHEVTTPILINGLLVGGIIKGKWMQYDEFYNSGVISFDGYHYDVYTNDTEKGTATGGFPIHSKSGEILQGDKYMPEFNIIDLYDENHQKVEYDIALNTDWDVFPRSYSNQSANQKNYHDLVEDLLSKEGLKNPDTALKQVIRVDLEGDGTEEVLITADNTADDKFEQVMKGDNAIVVFRRLVNGKTADQVVEKDIRIENEEEASIYRLLYRIETFADLDGDGILEVIIKSWYYEGEGWSVYKLIENRLELVASNGSGA